VKTLGQAARNQRSRVFAVSARSRFPCFTAWERIVTKYDPERLSPIEPDRVVPYTIDFWRPTGNLFAKGHRIRVEISSSYYPYYLRNLNSGADNLALATQGVVAHQTIRHDAEHPSHIVLPSCGAVPGVGSCRRIGGARCQQRLSKDRGQASARPTAIQARPLIAAPA